MTNLQIIRDILFQWWQTYNMNAQSDIYENHLSCKQLISDNRFIHYFIIIIVTNKNLKLTHIRITHQTGLIIALNDKILLKRKERKNIFINIRHASLLQRQYSQQYDTNIFLQRKF